MTTFARLDPALQSAIVTRLGWTSLRPVQELAGAALLDGHNAVVLAPTAGGKTEASIFPALSLALHRPPRGVGILYVAPIKALLNNQAERLGHYCEMVGLRRFVWHGDTSASAKTGFARDPGELLMTTPESLEVMLISPRVEAEALFSDLRIVIIDEVHALAGTDRGAHLMSVLERLRRVSQHDIQRVGLSATVGNPDAILEWLRGSSSRPGVVVDPPKTPARRELLVLHDPELGGLARDAAKLAKGKKSLCFCQSRAVAESIAERMRGSGTEVFVHHSAVARDDRERAEASFHHGQDVCIVCTSTLELGIDVGDLDRVLQVDAPDTVGSFLQRMGRTGRRAGQSANMTFLCETSEAVLQAIALVELARSGYVEPVPILRRCWPVLVHQLFALALADDGVAPEVAWSQLCVVPDLAGIRREEFDTVIAHMLAEQWLRLASARLVLGPKAERRFGRRNFMDLYAVFTSPQSYAVEDLNGRPVGVLSQAFVDRLVEGVSTFLLGGRAWGVVAIRHHDRLLKAEPAPRGRQPTWGGASPHFLSAPLCQKILEILTTENGYPYLHPSGEAALGERRAALRDVLDPGRGGLEETSEELRWWNFAGGQINTTLKSALLEFGEWKIIPDNFSLRIRGEGHLRHDFDAAAAHLRDPAFWNDDGRWREIATGLPNFRLSKFQDVLPPWAESEMLASFAFDRAGALEAVLSTRGKDSRGYEPKEVGPQ